MACKKAKGKRAKQRDKLKKKGRTTINKFLELLENDSVVQVNIDSSIHSGLPHHRFQGKTGVIESRRGACYMVALKDGNMRKSIIVHPAHLRKLKVKEAN